MKFLFISLLVFLVPVTQVLGQEHIWVIGGGPVADNSQVQIEFNTRWVQQILEQQKPGAKVQYFFTDGNEPGSDVVIHEEIVEWPPLKQSFERVFGTLVGKSARYRTHEVENVAGGTRLELLVPALEKGFSEVLSDDSVLLVYQGHGDRNFIFPSKNSLKLWGDTRLSVEKLENLISVLPDTTPVRFFMPQCFSGGFSRLIYPDVNSSRPPKPMRCGFMAEWDYEESEGCTGSVNEADYRDYTSYFFAALDGKTRTNKKLAGNPDRNGDGEVGLREAHFYSLAYGQSSDLPRSTSEAYLDQWQPWYLRWIESGEVPKNSYSLLAREVAANNNIELDGSGRINNARGVAEALLGKRRDLEKRLTHTRDKGGAVHQSIKATVLQQWPDARHPDTPSYAQFLEQDLVAAQNWILKHEEYSLLVKLQKDEEKLVRKLLDNKREITQLQKVNHLNRLAQLVEEFKRTADPVQQGIYNALVQCEERPL